MLAFHSYAHQPGWGKFDNVLMHDVADVQDVETEARSGSNVLQPLDNTPKPLNLLMKLSQVPKSHERPMQLQPEEFCRSLSSHECRHAQQSPEKLRLMR